MPVVDRGTPTINVTVPVPTPVQQQPQQQPAAAPPQPVPQGGTAPALPPAPGGMDAYPQMPAPTAFLLPYAPPPKKVVRRSRTLPVVKLKRSPTR